MNILLCGDCHTAFEHRRNDIKRCIGCSKLHKAAYNKEWSQRPDKILRKAELHRNLRIKAYAGYGGECACCGETEFEFLCIDHVNGGGAEDRKKHSTWQIARRVIELDFPDDYQVLCHNCNLAKGFFGECPHQRKRVS